MFARPGLSAHSQQAPAKSNPVAGQRCVYCGDPATDQDHVPSKKWQRLGIKGRLVPACDFCNRQLSDRKLFTLAERHAFIRAKLWRKGVAKVRSGMQGVWPDLRDRLRSVRQSVVPRVPKPQYGTHLLGRLSRD